MQKTTPWIGIASIGIVVGTVVWLTATPALLGSG
jgi:hypothetical protein